MPALGLNGGKEVEWLVNTRVSVSLLSQKESERVNAVLDIDLRQCLLPA